MSPSPASPPRRTLTRVGSGLTLALLVACGGGGGGGKPDDPGLTPNSVDVTIDREAIEDSLLLSDETFAADDCAVLEGATSAGARRLLRFDMIVVNMGELDLTIGDPTDPVPPITPADFEHAPCHDHFHFTGWATYELKDGGGGVAALGHKQAFCLIDTLAYELRPSQGYDCDFQGLSSGWGDLYDRTLDGQWVDVTGVPAGTYRLVVTVNVEGKVVEASDVWANSVSVDVVIPDPNQPLP